MNDFAQVNLPDAAAHPAEESDIRSSARRRMLKTAFAAFNDQFCAVSCIVRNQSDTGAKLEFTDMSLIPDSFWLHVELDGFKVLCTQVWQTGSFCGVTFVGEKIATRLHRTQTLQTSEDALSRQTLQDIELRERLQPVRAQKELSVRQPKGPQKAAFGRRS